MRCPLKKSITIILATSFFLLMAFCCPDQKASADTSLLEQNQQVQPNDTACHGDASHDSCSFDCRDCSKIVYISSKNSLEANSSSSIPKYSKSNYNAEGWFQKPLLDSSIFLAGNYPPTNHRSNVPAYLQTSVLRI